jgi:hypothetical protein
MKIVVNYKSIQSQLEKFKAYKSYNAQIFFGYPIQIIHQHWMTASLSYSNFLTECYNLIVLYDQYNINTIYVQIGPQTMIFSNDFIKDQFLSYKEANPSIVEKWAVFAGDVDLKDRLDFCNQLLKVCFRLRSTLLKTPDSSLLEHIDD